MPFSISHSAGIQKPLTTVPDNACDAHIHLYDARLAPPGALGMLEHATADDYRLVQQRLGTTRTVIVNPRACQTDNRVTLDGIVRLGRAQTRGVAVVRADVTDQELCSLDEGGICGIRFSLYQPDNAAVSFEMVQPLARRVAALGWHVQLHWTADQIVEHQDMLRRLPSTIVFDHLARLPMPQGISHPAHAIVCELLDQGRTWLKLSGAYLDSAVGGQQGYRDLDPVAQSWLSQAPDRLVWGSDWPHPTEKVKPNDADLMDVLGRWAGEPSLLKKVLVDNPASLYGF